MALRTKIVLYKYALSYKVHGTYLSSCPDSLSRSLSHIYIVVRSVQLIWIEAILFIHGVAVFKEKNRNLYLL
jgi:hypothetical protein